jgi:membrane protein
MKKIYNFFNDYVFGKELGVLPGSLAYSFFLAIIPILSLLFYLLSSFNLPLDMVQNFLSDTFPEGVVNLLQPIFTDTITMNSIITLVIAIMVATNGCNAIILASNTIYNIENTSIVRRTIKSLFLTIVMIILIAFVVVVPLFGKSILNVLLKIFVGQEKFLTTLFLILRVPVSLVVIFAIIKLLYVVAPDQRINSKYVNRGTAFTTICWLIVTYIYSFYINNIARYDLVYGNLTNIVILLLWFYILAYVFVIGLYLNRHKTDTEIEKTNTYKLEEIRKKVQKEKHKK